MAFYDFSKRELQQSDIHALRQIARSVGVSSPTSKKKQVLVDEILAIVAGDLEPEFKNANRGRPAKQENIYFYPTEKFAFGAAAASPDNFSDGKSGIVVFENGKVFIKKLRFMPSASDVEISNNIAQKYNLKDNDVVSYENVGGEIKITKINGAAVLRDVKAIAEHKLAFGQMNLLIEKNATEFAKTLSNECLVLFLPSSSLEKVSGENILSLPYSVADDTEIANNFLAAISLATFYQKSGKPTALVVSNILNIESSFKNLSILDLFTETFDYLNRYISSGGTVVALSRERTKEKFLFKYDVIE